MASAIGFSGLATGLDTEMLIEALLINKQRRVTTINESMDTIEKKKTALSDLDRILGVLDSAATDLSEVLFDNKSVSSSDEDAFTATADASASLSAYDLQINNLAQKSVITVGKAQTSSSEVIGAGTINLSFSGNDPISVTLSDGASTLSDLRDALNDQHGDSLNASIVEVESGSFQLVISTDSSGGDWNIFDEGDGGSSSAIAGFDGTFLDATMPNSGGITRTQDGKDAEITLDGITIFRASNEISDVITGVTLNLKRETTGPETLSIAGNQDDMVKGLKEFANAYNDALKEIDKLSGAEGIFVGDSSLRSLRSDLQNTLSRSLPAMDLLNTRDDGSVGFTSLAQIGFDSDRRTGEITLDEEKLREALDESFSEVENLFKGNYQTSNSNVTYLINTGNAFHGTMVLDTQNDTATVNGQLFNLIRDGSSLKFADDTAYQGMVFFADASDTNVTMNISDGIGRAFSDITGAFVDFNGVLDDRKNTLDSDKSRLDDQLLRAEEIVENERTRLMLIFSKAEQSVSQLQSLQSSLSALG
jgi:flagellar hook-associated protein 2